MTDVRLNIVKRRLEKVKNIIAIGGAKGGIGKSTFTVALAFCLAKKNFSVGILDLDFTSSSIPLILGIRKNFLKEENGLIPYALKDYKIKIFSLAFYLKDKPLSLREKSLVNLFREILTTVQWRSLDFLILDLPPGLKDIFLESLRLIKEIKFIILFTSSILSQEIARKNLILLKNLKKKVLGTVENMTFERKNKLNFPKDNFLGKINFDLSLEKSLGKKELFLKTNFVKEVEKISEKILKDKKIKL